MPVTPTTVRNTTSPSAAAAAVRSPAAPARAGAAPARSAGASTFTAARPPIQAQPRTPSGTRFASQAAGRTEAGIDPEEALKARCADCIRPALIPSEAQVDEIRGLIIQSFGQMGEQQQQTIQKALDKTVQYYGIPVSSLENGRVVFNPALAGIGGKAEGNGTAHIGPGMIQEAFEFGPHLLALGISHEATHISQIQKHHDPGYHVADRQPGWVYETQSLAGYELMAYEDGLRLARQFGLPQAMIGRWTHAAEEYREILTPENRERYAAGQYWGLGAPEGQEGHLPERHDH